MRPAKRRTASRVMPASSGLPGPGESTRREGASSSTSSRLMRSLRTTRTSSEVSSHRYWYRFQVKES